MVEHNLAKVRVASSSLVFRSKKVLHVRHWKGGRVVDYSGLENRRAERHRGFESLPFRREASSESCSLFFCYSNFTRLLLDLKEEARNNPSWRNRANVILRSVHHFLNLSAEVSPRHANEKIVSMLMATLLL